MENRKVKRNVDGKPVYKMQVDTPVGDWWADIFPVSKTGSDRVGFPTQKPKELAKRVIAALTNEGDVVFDPFMGSGTTLVAAAELNRCFIGIDNEQTAFNKTIERLRAEGYGFTIINGEPINIKAIEDMNGYEYQSFIVNKLGGLVGGKGADGGIDGKIISTNTGIWVTRTRISRPMVDRFKSALEKNNMKNGIMVSPNGLSKDANEELLRIHRVDKLNIVFMSEDDLVTFSEPKVDFLIEGTFIKAVVTGFKNPIAKYTWYINDDSDINYLFGAGKKNLNVTNNDGKLDISGVINDVNDEHHIQCVVTDIKGNAVSSEIVHKF